MWRMWKGALPDMDDFFSGKIKVLVYVRYSSLPTRLYVFSSEEEDAEIDMDRITGLTEGESIAIYKLHRVIGQERGEKAPQGCGVDDRHEKDTRCAVASRRLRR